MSHNLHIPTRLLQKNTMDCCSKPTTSPPSSSDRSPPKKLSPSCQQPSKHREQEESEPILSLWSPLDPETEYRVVWAKKSLWKRRLEGLQQRYPSDKELDCNYSSSDEESDDDDDATWIMDNSQKSHAPSQEDRWGESSSSSLPSIRRLEDSDDDDDNATTVSCPSQIGMSRWGDDREASASTDKILVSCQASSSRSISSKSSSVTAPRVPCRRASLQDGSETPRVPCRRAFLLQHDSEMSSHTNNAAAPYAVSWLDGFYSTVREIREDRQNKRPESIVEKAHIVTV